MSDLEIIIPVAIVAVLALTLGSGSGNPIPEPSYDDLDSMTWIEDVDSVQTNVEPSKETIMDAFETVSSKIGKIQQLAQALDEASERDDDVISLEEDLKQKIKEFKEISAASTPLLSRYLQYYKNKEEELTKQIDTTKDPLNKKTLQNMLRDCSIKSHEAENFRDHATNILYRAEESIRLNAEAYQPIILPDGFDEHVDPSELGGYAISETNSAFVRSVPVASKPSFNQGVSTNLHKLPAPITQDDDIPVPDIPEPQTYFSTPKPINRLLDLAKLKSTIQESRDLPQTPPSLKLRIEQMNRGIKTLPAVNERISLAQNAGFKQAQRPSVNFVSGEIRSVSKFLNLTQKDKTDYTKQLETLERDFRVASRNNDTRKLKILKTRVRNSAPPGTPSGSFYNSMSRKQDLLSTGGKKLSFSELSEDNLYQKYKTLFDKIEEAEI